MTENKETERHDILTEKENTIIRNATGNPYLTNCYLSYHVIMSKIETHEIHFFGYDTIVILIHRIAKFHKIYYFLENKDILIPELVKKIQKDLDGYPNLEGTVVARISDRNIDVLEKLGFYPYKEYIRKQMTTPPENWCEAVQVTKTADIRDLNAIYQLLYKISDVMSDHLVSKEELYTFLEASQVLKVVIDEELAGVLLFESFGKKSYLRSICVADKFIGRKIGLSLIKGYIEKNKNRAKLFYLWVESTNERAIRLYKNIGYKDDGVREYIYLY